MYTVTVLSLDRFSLGNHIADRSRLILVAVGVGEVGLLIWLRIER